MNRGKIIKVFLLLLLFIFSLYLWDNNIDPNNNIKDKAVIVDGLLEFSNSSFINTAAKILTDSGYEVSIIEPDKVTVDFYKNLPSRGYEIIILRVHCGPLRTEIGDGSYIPEGTVFFTTESYNAKDYQDLQNNGLLAVAKIRGNEEDQFFAIPPVFFENLENFHNSTIILDSCYGFWSGAPLVMAETLRQKGVRTFIGWDGEVQAHHTDAAVINLLKKIMLEGNTINESIEKTMNEIGKDPYYKTRLLYYPKASGDIKIIK
ncbi:hypothetical protein GF319_00690 [Candidatus Bathyarchaeota archaeon]|nr:hypothetical protein [Candidatus Bathyarchaeota archaeon]